MNEDERVIFNTGRLEQGIEELIERIRDNDYNNIESCITNVKYFINSLEESVRDYL